MSIGNLLRYDSVIIRRYEREEELEHAIKRALRMGTFEVWYQPVFYRETQSFDSAEALLRMTDSEMVIVFRQANLFLWQNAMV